MASTNDPTKPVTEVTPDAEKDMSKYPRIARPGSQFLQKRLQKGQKFFDSGDYNMAKAAAAKGSGKARLPESKLNQGHPLLPPTPNLPPNTTGDAIPTPDCLATRKASINVPSKLVSGGP